MLKAQRKFEGTFMLTNTKLGPSDFDGKHLKRPGTMVVLFAAEWCPFCQRFSPIFESALAQKDAPRALADLSDLQNPLWEILDIQVVPTVVVFEDGEPVYRKDGILGQGLSSSAMEEVVRLLPAGHKVTD